MVELVDMNTHIRLGNHAMVVGRLVLCVKEDFEGEEFLLAILAGVKYLHTLEQDVISESAKTLLYLPAEDIPGRILSASKVVHVV